MKKVILVILSIFIFIFAVSCENASTVANVGQILLDTVEIKIVVQGDGDAGLKLTHGNTIVEKHISTVNGYVLNVPLDQEVTASLVSAVGETEIPAVFWYGSAVNNLEQSDLVKSSITFKAKKKSYLGIFINGKSTELELQNVVINFHSATGSVIVFDKISRIGPLEYKLPKGFLFDIEARNFGYYNFYNWLSESEVINTNLKFTAEIKSDTNITAKFIKDSTSGKEYIEDFTFSASIGGSIKVIIKEGDVLESETIVSAGDTVNIPINLARFEDGSVVAIASPRNGYTFDNWENANYNTSSTLNVETTMADVITANFKRYQVLLTLNIVCPDVNGDKDGVISVTKDNKEITYNETVSVYYDTNSIVNLNAKVGRIFKFKGWSGDIKSDNLSYINLHLNKDTTINATFEKNKVNLSLVFDSSNGATNGKIRVNEVDYPYSIDSVYAEVDIDSSVDIEALDLLNGTFVNWSGDLKDTTRKQTIIADSDKTIKAHFKKSSVGDGDIKKPEEINNTYSIKSISEFNWIIKQSSSDLSTKIVKLENDLDFENEAFIGINREFKGVFDGNGKKIKNVNMESDGYFLSFFHMVNDSVIKDLTISGNLNSKLNDDGTIAGIITLLGANVTISNVTSEINITANYLKYGATVGGIVGSVGKNAKLYNVTNTGNIEASADIVGGIVGVSLPSYSDTTISNALNKGNITCTIENIKDISYVGGIVGRSDTKYIYQVVNRGNISGGTETGGILGGFAPTGNDMIIDRAANFGNVSGKSRVGGIVGRTAQFKRIIRNVYNVGTVTSDISSGAIAAGGIVGLINFYDSNTDIKYAYNIGSISGNFSAKGNITGIYYSTNTPGNYEGVYALNILTYDIYKETSGTSYRGEKLAGVFQVNNTTFNTTTTVLNGLKNNNPDANIWGEKTITSVNGVTKRPYIIGLE